MDQPGSRYAWYGRVSTEDEQDPTLSFPRQLGNAERRVANAGGRIVAHYYDIESGTRRYDARGSGGLAGFDIPIPRDGGLHDLLAAASRRPLAFDRVIVESISRLSRNSSVAFRIEEELATAGVRLCAADEPLEESFGTIVLRHVNIGIARGYHHELMVKSRQGLETATRQGWHVGGIAPYGYRFVTHEHPNPHKAKQGAQKHTLELDPVRAPVVRRIFDLYLSGGLGITRIAEVLNADLEHCPAPVKPDPTQSLGHWSRASLWEILHNPKYTGYQVWNRRARKRGGKINPPEAWTWSEEPAHEAIITRAEHDEVMARTARRTHSAASSPKAQAPGREPYLYRSILICGACGLRMWGKTRRSSVCYQCQATHQNTRRMPEGHPAHVHLAESRLNLAVLGFLGAAVFGADRVEYWRRNLAEPEKPEASPAQERIAELNAEIEDMDRRRMKQVLALEAPETTQAMFSLVARRIQELEAAIVERRVRLEALEAQLPPEAPRLEDVALVLERLPVLGQRLAELPRAELRAIFDSLQLTVTYHHDSRDAIVEITLRASANLTKDGAQVSGVPPVGFEPTLRGF